VETLARRNLLLNKGGTSRERQQELDGTGKSPKSPPESMICFATDHGAALVPLRSSMKELLTNVPSSQLTE
jgi:hypothetical protein